MTIKISDMTAAATLDGSELVEIVQSSATFRTTVELINDATTKAQVGLGSVTDDAQLAIANNLSDVASASTSRVNLGLSTKAEFNTALTDGSFAFDGGAFHDGFSDFVANEHIDHTGVTLTAGAGLTGGGDISANRTFDLTDMAVNTIKGRITAGTGVPEDLTGAQVRTIINTLDEDGMTSNSDAALATQQSIKAYVDAAAAAAALADGDYGDITVSLSGSVMTIDAGVVSLAKMADMATASLIGRNTAATGVPEVLSKATALGLLNVEDGADVTDAVNVGTSIDGAAAKATPVDADTTPLIDSAASNVLKKVTWANIKATLKTYFDALYQAYHAILASLAGLTIVAGDIIYATASNTLANLAKGTDGQVLTLASGLPSWAAGGGGAGIPIGSVIPYAGNSTPALYLLCYGQNVSRTTYADLYTAIGTIHGVGDSSTTFGIPDLRGRVVAGEDDMGGTSANRLTSPLNGDTMGAVGGSESHTLVTSEMPAHTHTKDANTGIAGGGNLGTLRTPSSNATSSTGGGGAHANVQPTIILKYMIYAGV